MTTPAKISRGQQSAPPAFTIETVRWESIGPDDLALSNAQAPRRSIGLFNLGRKSWPLVVRNRQTQEAFWLADGADSSAAAPQLSLVTREFVVSGKNRFGSQVFVIRYRFLARSSGGAAASEQSIRQLSITLGEVSIAWGWIVDMTAVVQDLEDWGDAAAPISVLPVKIELRIDTQLKSENAAKVHLVSPRGIGLRPTFP